MALGADGTFLEYHFHIFELAKKKKNPQHSPYKCMIYILQRKGLEFQIVKSLTWFHIASEQQN